MNPLKTNLGTLDRGIRIVTGLVLLILFAAGVIGAWGLIGIALLLSGLLRYCPVYDLLGFHSGHTPPQRLP
jgi:hypothetical protein